MDKTGVPARVSVENYVNKKFVLESRGERHGTYIYMRGYESVETETETV